MAEENNLSRAPRDFDRRPGGRDRGGYNEGAAWNRRPARRDMDIVDKELNRYQPAFDKVQRYPEGYGGQPTRRGGGGFGGGRRGGGDRSGQIDRLIGAIEGMGRGGNVTNTFNPTFNPTNVNAGRDIRDTAILGGDNTAGRDIVGAGSGDVETGDGGGGNVVGGGSGNVDVGGGDTGGGDTGGGDTGGGDDTNKYDTFINKTYNDLLGRDAGEEGKTYWSGDLESGQTEDQVISNIKLSDEYKNREAAKGLASSMEGKTYEKDTASSLGNINEASLDAWVGPGGGLTQSSDPTGKSYYEGVGDKSSAAEYLYNRPVGDGDATIMGFPSDLSERDEKIYDLYTNVFGRNPDKEGFDYWTSDESDKMSLADIEASFKGSAEQKLRDQVSGTNNFVSTDDYIAGKQNRGSANVSGTVDNYLELLGAKDTLIGAKDTLIGDKDTLIGDKDTLLADKDTLLGDKDALLGAKDQLISDFNTDQAAKDDLLSRFTADQAAKDDLISRFTADQAAKDKQIADLQQQQVSAPLPIELRQSLAGDTDPEMLGMAAKQLGLDPEKSPDIVGAVNTELAKRDIQDRVALMYKDLLGRDADPEGLNYWTQEILNNPTQYEGPGVGPQSYQKAIDMAQDNIMRSDEYQQRKNRGRDPREDRRFPTPIVGPFPQPPARPIAPDIGDPGPREPEIRRPKPSLPPRENPDIIPIMPTPGPGVQIDPPRPVTPKVDNWLQDFYNQAGINAGVLDSGAKSYWEAEAAKVGKDKAKEIILGTAKAQNNFFPTR
jgi:hypothetical protein